MNKLLKRVLMVALLAGLVGCTGLSDLAGTVVGVMPENAQQVLARNGNAVRVVLVDSQQNATYSLNVDFGLGHAHTGVYCDTGEKVFDVNALIAQIRPDELVFWQGVRYELLIDAGYFVCGQSYSCQAVSVPGVGYSAEIPGYGVEVYGECAVVP